MKQDKRNVYCVFVPLKGIGQENCYICSNSNCKQTIIKTKVLPIHRECGGQYKGGKPPSLINRAKNFSIAYNKWKKAGKPIRDENEMNRVYNICLQCPKFNEKKKECNLCGCKLDRHRRYINKLAWATESCPDNPSKWNATVNVD